MWYASVCVLRITIDKAWVNDGISFLIVKGDLYEFYKASHPTNAYIYKYFSLCFVKVFLGTIN